jgi:hypothetical protein
MKLTLLHDHALATGGFGLALAPDGKVYRVRDGHVVAHDLADHLPPRAANNTDEL